MKKVFVDTAAWLALLNIDDIWHQQAKEIRLELVKQNYIFITTEFVLLEVGDALCSQVLRKNTANFLHNIYQLKSTKIITLSQDLLQLGLSLYEQRLDKDWGLTDCVSFVVMQREKIQEAFTSDKHFEQAGFIRLLQNN
ncbi:MAG: type II toxin-antitoxin system VapC family toxin [Snowella sp.]